jgi:hypothetical protein
MQRLFERVVAPADLAVVVGNACGYIPLVLAELVGKDGAVRVFDANIAALSRSLAEHSDAARVVTAQRSCLSMPVNLSSDRVWGRAPACLQGYVARSARQHTHTPLCVLILLYVCMYVCMYVYVLIVPILLY